MIGIYCILNKIDFKRYIVQSVDVDYRLYEHKNHIETKVRHSNRLLQNAIHKYGIENFEFLILEECSRENLNEREKYYIEYYRTYVGFEDCKGYNLTLGGDGTLGFKITEEVSIKLSEALIRNWSDPAYRKKQSASRSHPRTPEHSRAISDGIKASGKFPSKDHMLLMTEKAREVNLGRKMSEEQKVKLSKSLKGIKRSPEACLNISRSKSGVNSPAYGKVWVHSVTEEKYIPKESLESFINDNPEWSSGRMFRKRNRNHET